MTMKNDITELALLVSKAKASVFTLEYISQFESADIDSDDVDLRFEVDGRDTGTNVSIVDECGQAAKVIGSLVEALEKAQRYIEELREWNVGLAQESCEYQQRIAEIQPIHAAAEKLVRCKGRYHSELNYRALAALFGVTTPDLPPLDSESRTVTAAAADVFSERQRQMAAEGWTPERDDEYTDGELLRAASCYALMAWREKCLSDGEYTSSQKALPYYWPWEPAWWKPTTPRRDLVKAGALILAEIERIDRAAGIKVEDE